MSAGDWALLILAVFWAILVIVLAVLSVRVFRLLDSTTRTLDDFRGELVPILTDVNYVEPLPLSAIYPAGRHRLPKVRVFLDFVIERFSHAPWRSAHLVEKVSA